VSSWNFADVWEVVAGLMGDRTATAHGGEHRSWTELNRRADGVARWMLGLGVRPGETCAQYLYSSPPYLEALFASFKLGIPPVNTNYRYGGDELRYLWDNADTAAVVFHGSFSERVEALRSSLPRLRGYLWVDDGSGGCPGWADSYDEVIAGGGADHVRAPWGRTADDLYLLYTGGTTGSPKGVMWRQDDLFALLNRTAPVRYPEQGGLDDVRTMLVKPGPSVLPAAPLMHGTGMFCAMPILSSGGTVVTLTGRSFSAVEFLDTVQAEGVKSTAIVGDAFARPILDALDAEPQRWDISSLRVVTSSGVMWSAAVKEGLLAHNPRLLLVDTLGSSEAIGMASSISTSEGGRSTAAVDGPAGAARAASFTLGPDTRVVTEDGLDVAPGSGQTGMVALRGRVPVGYWKDEKKSAQTFRVLDGQRWSIPGDFATVEADGTLRLLGRGSQCINTGGEKVYPEEVEEVLKTAPDVVDAVCVGTPDLRFGEAITALVELRPGTVLNPDALIAHVRAHLAHYKAPRHVFELATVGRAPNGKVDYARLKALAVDLSGSPPGPE